ncbi:MAG: hypothetical protein HS130_01920 [Deltaproteobacteria bacterium]|nr:hypothetical protein [Deltaproteobacteria bacterium]
MKRLSLALATAGMALFFAPSAALPEININIGINAPPPAIVVKAPPAVVVIPGTYTLPLILTTGLLLRRLLVEAAQGGWYRSRGVRRPWVVIK